HAYYGRTLRHRPLEEVAAELEGLRGQKLFLVDDNLFVDVELAGALFRVLGENRIRWACQVSADISLDGDLLDLMAANGCVTALVGFESLHPENLSQMGKRWSQKAGSHGEVVRRFRERGIMVYGTFVFGYDQDTPESFDATVDFAIRSRMCLANFNPLTPTPGTRLYDRLRHEGRLRFPRWWLDPDFHYGDALFEPRGMTPKDLTDGCYRARRGFNTRWATLRRGLDPRANCRTPVHVGLFWVANRVSRREIHRKQGRTLGSGVPLPAELGPLEEDLYRAVS
ncbi:MAG: B12-binding domain-containing radical SAM protein, partial [Longimicrobiales bacterium]